MIRNDKYTINPETGKIIKVGSPIWKRLASMHYIMGDQFTDQIIPDPRVYKASKVNKANKLKVNRLLGKRVAYPEGVKRYIMVGRKTWNERYIEYEWNGYEYGSKRSLPLTKAINTVEKRGEITYCIKFYLLFDRKVAEGRLLDVIQSSLGYALTYYHTVDRNMCKE